MIVSRHLEIQDQFITNKPLYGPHPRNKPWEYFLFATKVQTIRSKIGYLKIIEWQRRKKYIHTITAWRKREADRELARLIHRKDVKLITKEAV